MTKKQICKQMSADLQYVNKNQLIFKEKHFFGGQIWLNYFADKQTADTTGYEVVSKIS